MNETDSKTPNETDSKTPKGNSTMTARTTDGVSAVGETVARQSGGRVVTTGKTTGKLDLWYAPKEPRGGTESSTT